MCRIFRCKHIYICTFVCLSSHWSEPLQGHRIVQQTGFHFVVTRVNENIRNIKNLETDIFLQVTIEIFFGEGYLSGG